MQGFNIGLDMRKLAKNKGADKPVHLRRLISAFVIRLLESIVLRLATTKIHSWWDWFESRFETPKTGFLASRPIFKPASVAEQVGLRLT